ncbi:MAG: DNA-binding protein WhiA [Firmicutes bacterium]|nr:DNA-binding protein WhiA [Bacillota bacterium]MCL2771225.1 DNA-binding protein WhiA [Bacillota bacterium]
MNFTNEIKNEILNFQPKTDFEKEAWSLGTNIIDADSIEEIQTGLVELLEDNFAKVEKGKENLEYIIIKTIIKAAFFSSGASNIIVGDSLTKQTSHGYHLQFVLPSAEAARFLLELIAELDILCGMVARGKNFVVYISGFEQVILFLKEMEFSKAVLTLENENAMRAIRKQANREFNSAQFNLKKQEETAQKQVLMVEEIEKLIGLDNLPKPVAEVARKRLLNPELSLEELGAELGLTKSGLRHRLRKLEEIYSFLIN